MKGIGDFLKNTSPPKKKKPNSQRSLYIQDIADLTGMPFMVIFGKVSHLIGESGTKAIKDMYELALRASTERKWRRIKFWKLLEESKKKT